MFAVHCSAHLKFAEQRVMERRRPMRYMQPAQCDGAMHRAATQWSNSHFKIVVEKVAVVSAVLTQKAVLKPRLRLPRARAHERVHSFKQAAQHARVLDPYPDVAVGAIARGKFLERVASHLACSRTPSVSTQQRWGSGCTLQLQCQWVAPTVDEAVAVQPHDGVVLGNLLQLQKGKR